MQSKAPTVEAYIDSLSGDHRLAVERLYQTALTHLPPGFVPQMLYGMITFVVPLSTYPSGYHVGKNIPLSFIAIASQKNYISFYTLALYANGELESWFVNAYQEITGKPLNKGKSCLRFRHSKDIPYDLIGELLTKMTPQQWIDYYESERNQHSS